MTPVVTLSDETFGKLQSLAEPFVDTPESVISSLANAELERRAISASTNGRGSERNDLLQLNPDSHENLAHTKLLSATVDGRPVHRPKWNGLLDYLHVLGRSRMGSFEALRQASGANLREGKYEESGFKYLPQADLSIQGVDANLAWDHSLRLARSLQVPIEVTLQWRMKEGAARPGQRGALKWAPMSS